MPTENDAEQQTPVVAEKAGPKNSPSVGETLRQLRESRQLSEKEVADKLHITMHYVRAIEANKYEKLPGEIFAKGYIKSYALLLELDPGELLAQYDAYQSRRQDRKEEAVRRVAQRQRNRNLPWVLASVFAAIACVLLAWWGITSWRSNPPVANSTPSEYPNLGQSTTELSDSEDAAIINERIEEVSPPPIAEPELPPAEFEVAAELVSSVAAVDRVYSVVAEGDDLLRISFSGDSWVEVSDSNQIQIYRDLRESGDILEITGQAPFSILLGDAPFTQMTLNGNEIDVSSEIRIDNSARLTVGL